MSEVELWIEAAAQRLGVDVKRLNEQAANALVSSLKERYVRGNPRVWWLDLAVAFTTHDSSKLRLSSVLPSLDGEALLIPETEGEELPVYQTYAAALEELIVACPYFEYYVAGGKLEWLVIESDHNVFYVCHEKER